MSDRSTSAAINTARQRLPSEPLRTSALAAQLAGWVAVAVLASAARAVLPLGSLYPLKAFVLFGAAMGLALRALADNHRFAAFGLANQITTARAVLVSLVAGFIGESDARLAVWAVGLGALVVLMDGIDGWAARRSRMASSFGARFDMEIDALLIMTLAVLAWQFGKAGAWVVLSGLLRYLFLAAGWLWPRLSRPLLPSRRRQSICVAQVVTLIVVIAPGITPPAGPALAAGVLMILCYSFLVDTLYLLKTKVD